MDIGAGPGTASWAMAQTWESLGAFTLIDHSETFLDLAKALCAEAEAAPLRQAKLVRQDLRKLDLESERADLIVVSYALTELVQVDAAALVARLASACGVLVIVEPGAPRDYARLMQTRAQLIAAGAKLLAPCPHANACPLPADDWCHFSVRLPRTRDHRMAKSASAPFEDEKFAYLAVDCGGAGGTPAPLSRVLRAPVMSKHDIRLKLCAPEGLSDIAVARRDAERYAIARKLDWGDGVELEL
jgi:ribosomal protein RSM22 (predicted rRNA methylase)